MPLITILLPVYNTELYIGEAIESILCQTYKDFELLIFDDGSTDNTREIIESFKDHRIIYKRSEKNTGYIDLLNEGLRVANGEYIARMDADDIAYPTRLEEQLLFLENNQDVGICGTWIKYFGSMNGVIERPISFTDVKYALLFGCPLTHPTIMMRKDLIWKYSLQYNKEFYYAEDHDFFATAASYFKVVNIPKVLLKYRVHVNQIASTKWQDQLLAKSKIQAKIFSKILSPCSESDKKWLVQFFTEKCVPSSQWLDQVLMYKKSIIKSNIEQQLYSNQKFIIACNNIFDEKIRGTVNKYFLKTYYNNNNFNLRLFSSLLRNEYNFLKFINTKLLMFFFVKCVLNWRTKNNK